MTLDDRFRVLATGAQGGRKRPISAFPNASSSALKHTLRIARSRCKVGPCSFVLFYWLLC